MKRKLRHCLLAALCGGWLASAAAQLPPPPPLPPAPGGAHDLGRGNWRNLPPAQREAIRRLSREEREALANRLAARPGGGGAPGRLSPEERRQLRAQIREEHERRSGRIGGGKRF